MHPILDWTGASSVEFNLLCARRRDVVRTRSHSITRSEVSPVALRESAQGGMPLRAKDHLSTPECNVYSSALAAVFSR